MPFQIARSFVCVLVLGALIDSCNASNAESPQSSVATWRGQSVSVTLTRTEAVQLESIDGQFIVEFLPQSVSAPTLVTLTPILSNESDGSDRAYGREYVLEPSDLLLEKAARFTVRSGALPQNKTPQQLRVARAVSDDESEKWLALERPEASANEVLGRSSRCGRFAAVATSSLQLLSPLPFTSTSEADVLFSRGDVVAAQAAYAAVLNQDPDNARANLGSALSSTLLLADSTAMRNVFARCGLSPLGPDLLYGRYGYLHRFADDAAGLADLEISEGSSQGRLVADTVVTRADSRGVLVQVENRSTTTTPQKVLLRFDLQQGQEQYVIGSSFAAATFPGRVELVDQDTFWERTTASTGQIRIDGAGRASGQRVAFELVNVVLIGAGNRRLHVNGRIDDVIASTPVPEHPLFSSRALAGPPNQSRFAVLLAGCSDTLTTPFLFSQWQLMQNELDDIAQHLRVVVAQLEATDEQRAQQAQSAIEQALSAFLLRSGDDLALSKRDLKLVAMLFEGLGQLQDYLALYRFFAYDVDGVEVPLRSFLQEQTLAYQAEDGSVQSRQEIAPSVSLVAADLSRNFFSSELDVSALVEALQPMQIPLQNALAEFADALTETGDGGLFDLDAPTNVTFAQELNALIGALAESAGAENTIVAVPNNAGYAFALNKLLTQPILRQLLVDVSGEALFVQREGDSQAEVAAARNPQLVMAPRLVDALLATFMTLPTPLNEECSLAQACVAEGSYCSFSAARCSNGGGACTSDSDCTASPCLGRCERQKLTLFSEAAIESAFAGDEPAIVNTVLWKRLAPLFVMLPHP